MSDKQKVIYETHHHFKVFHGNVAESGLLQQSWKLPSRNAPWVQISPFPPIMQFVYGVIFLYTNKNSNVLRQLCFLKFCYTGAHRVALKSTIQAKVARKIWSKTVWFESNREHPTCGISSIGRAQHCHCWGKGIETPMSRHLCPGLCCESDLKPNVDRFDSC